MASAPFDGERFDNIEPVPDKPISTLLKWKWTSSPANWPDWVDSIPGTIAEKEVRAGQVHVTFINHASFLIQLDGLNLITDPIWSERASPVSFAGPKRVRAPGILFENLPRIDAVLISHNHYDHLDLETLKRLKEAHDPVFLVGLKNKSLLDQAGISKVVELDWWQGHQLGPLNIVFTPAQHWSARGLFDKRKMLWGGFYIFGTQKVYFAGDTGWGSFFDLIREKMSAPDIAIIPIGAYEPRWFMKNFHINPEEAVKAHSILGAQSSIGMHFGTFQLTDEAIDAPILALEAAKKQNNVQNFYVPEFGKTLIFNKGEKNE